MSTQTKFLDAEKIVEKLDANVYPVTLVKYLLNRKRINSMFARAMDPSFGPDSGRVTVNTDFTKCPDCQTESRKSLGMLCRKHTSIQRIIDSKSVAQDIETGAMLTQNEIYKYVGNNKTVVIYCPHPKLITGEIDDEKVRKINVFTIEDTQFRVPNYEKITEFSSAVYMNESIKMWFNEIYSLMTMPYDRNQVNWVLVKNQLKEKRFVQKETI